MALCSTINHEVQLEEYNILLELLRGVNSVRRKNRVSTQKCGHQKKTSRTMWDGAIRDSDFPD